MWSEKTRPPVRGRRQFKYWVPTGVEVPSQLKTFELYQKSESETLEIFICLSWQLAVKVKGSTYCHWDEKFRNQQWKCELWAHSRWTTWIYLPTSCGFYQGDLGDVGLDLHLSWHAGDHHEDSQKHVFFTHATIVTTNALLKEAWGLTKNVKRVTCEKMLSFSLTSWWIIKEIHMQYLRWSMHSF